MILPTVIYFHCQGQKNWGCLFLSLLTHTLHILGCLWSNCSWKHSFFCPFGYQGCQKDCKIIHIMNSVKIISWLRSAAGEEAFTFWILVHTVEVFSQPLLCSPAQGQFIGNLCWAPCLTHQRSSARQASACCGEQVLAAQPQNLCSDLASFSDFIWEEFRLTSHSAGAVTNPFSKGSLLVRKH